MMLMGSSHCRADKARNSRNIGMHVPGGFRFLLGVCLFVLLIGLASATRVQLKHKDGTVVEGDVVSETFYEIQIKTKYGNLRYDKEDLEELKRLDQDTTSSMAGGTPKPGVLERIPRGPIDPLRPPELKALVGKGDSGTTPSARVASAAQAAGTTTAPAGAVATPQ